MHHLYKPNEPEFDLAILELDSSLPQRSRFMENQIHEPCVTGFTANQATEIIPFTLPVQEDPENTSTLFPESESTYLSNGHSGSPVYFPDNNNRPLLAGLFSAQEYSLDRTAPTKYFFARLDDVDFERDFALVIPEESPSYRALIPIRESGTIYHPIRQQNRFDQKKHLYAISFVVRAKEPLLLSLEKGSEQPASVIRWATCKSREKAYLKDMNPALLLHTNDCITLIFRGVDIPSNLILKAWLQPE